MYKSLALAIAIALTCGCTKNSDIAAAMNEEGQNELANKHQYSALQAVEATYAGIPHNNKPLLLPNAKGTDFTLIGLPKAASPTGSVWVIAAAPTPPEVKVLPANMPFLITSGQAQQIAHDMNASAAVTRFLQNAAGTK